MTGAQSCSVTPYCANGIHENSHARKGDVNAGISTATAKRIKAARRGPWGGAGSDKGET